MPLVVREFGLCDYTDIWQRMIRFTRKRDDQTDDEIWLLQHHAVYTQGTSCRDWPEPDAGSVPVVHSDRAQRTVPLAASMAARFAELSMT